jgi:hypothetical protein
MQRRRLAAAVLAALTAAMLAVPGVAAGAQADEESLVRVAHFAPGLLKGDVYVVYVNGRLQKLASGSISSLVAVGGIGEQLELLDISDAAAAVSAAGGVATGAGGTATSPSPGGRRFALLLLIGCGLAAATGFVVQQRWSSS